MLKIRRLRAAEGAKLRIRIKILEIEFVKEGWELYVMFDKVFNTRTRVLTYIIK